MLSYCKRVDRTQTLGIRPVQGTDGTRTGCGICNRAGGCVRKLFGKAPTLHPYRFPPVTGNEFVILINGKPVELQVHLCKSDALRIFTTVQDQLSSDS